MSRFNSAAPNTSKTTNLASGEAYTEDARTELVSMLLTSLVQDQYYRKSEDSLKRLGELMEKVDPLFAAKAAIYARDKFNMRSVSHAVAGEIALRYSGKEWIKNFFDKIVVRPDDITEIHSYYFSSGRAKVETNAMRKGLGRALARFDEYQLAKYLRTDQKYTLIDMANVYHPPHTEAIEKLMTGTLKHSSADTWEQGMQEIGRKTDDVEEREKLKAEVWIRLLKERKLGYFATLRNLRNIMEQAPAAVDMACEFLTNEKAVHNSRVLPFRFYTAYKEFANLNGPDARKIQKALATALDISVANMPDFGENTLVAIDHSGSMSSTMSEKSKATMFEIGALFGIALAKKSNADVIYFGDTAKYYNVRDDSVLSQIELLNSYNQTWGSSPTNVGHGTNFQAVFEEANRQYDHIFFFSDMQAWVNGGNTTGAFKDYNARHDINPKIYSFDLAGYGSLQFPQSNVACVAGFSDKVLDVLKKLDVDRNALVKEIEEIEL